MQILRLFLAKVNIKDIYECMYLISSIDITILHKYLCLLLYFRQIKEFTFFTILLFGELYVNNL